MNLASRLAGEAWQRRRAGIALVFVAAAVAGGVALGVSQLLPRGLAPTSNTAEEKLTGQTAAAPGSDVAWVAMQDKGEGSFVGVDPRGNRIAELPGVIGGAFAAAPSRRSPDGSRLYGFTLGEPRLQILNALNGRVVREIELRDRPAASSVSPDGSAMVLVAAGGNNRVEVIDLKAGSSAASLTIDLPTSWVVAGPGAHRIYLFSAGSRGTVLTALSFEDGGLRVDGRTTSKPNEPPVLDCASPDPPAFHFSSDGQTLVAFCPASTSVWWIDLNRLEVTSTLPGRPNRAFLLAPLYAPDGRSLYLYDADRGTIQVVDLDRRAIVREVTVPRAPASVGSFFPLVRVAEAKAYPGTAVISPDGQWIYLRDANNGVRQVHLPELAVRARWLDDVRPQRLWVSGEGRTLYAIDGSGRVLHAVNTQTGSRKELKLAKLSYGFLGSFDFLS